MCVCVCVWGFLLGPGPLAGSGLDLSPALGEELFSLTRRSLSPPRNPRSGLPGAHQSRWVASEDGGVDSACVIMRVGVVRGPVFWGEI